MTTWDEIINLKLNCFNNRTGRGSITKAQLGELMDTIGIDATAAEVDAMLRTIDLGNFEASERGPYSIYNLSYGDHNLIPT